MRILMILVGALLIAACDSSPTGGGVNTDPRECRSGKESGFPTSIVFSVTNPGCPIVIDNMYKAVAWGGRLSGPKTTFSSTSPVSWIQVLDYFSGEMISSDTYVPWYEDPNNTSYLYAVCIV